MLHKENDIIFSLVLPAHNEAVNIENCVKAVQKILEEYNYEIIIAEDGSNDGTDKIAENLASLDDRIIFLHDDTKLGRGLALKNAFNIARGERIGYIDVDMATDMKYLKELIEYSKDYDIVTGSRYMKLSKTKRPFIREIVSKTYNLLIRLMLDCEIYDSQCGFKAFSNKFVKKEIYNINENTWAWDTIIIVNGIKKGYNVKEFPVEWEEKKDSKHSASIKRIYKDIKIHGLVLIKLFGKYKMKLDIQL